MRLLTFSVLRNCKFKSLFYQIPRKWSSETVSPAVGAASGAVPEAVPEPEKDSMLEFCPSWPSQEEALRTHLQRDMRVLTDFVSEAEEQAFMQELEPVFKRMRYEYDHWDDAIHGFRETERTSWKSPEAAAVLARVVRAAFSAPGAGAPLPHQHVLDLAPAGHIKPHIDAVRFCGEVVAGLCLLSDAVMRLQHEKRPQLALRAYLPRRCLYIMRGVARYDFTHAVAGNEESAWGGRRVVKRRRVAVITRSQPKPGDAPAAHPPAQGGGY